MKFISAFSGVGGFDLGLSLAGMECVAQIEIDGQCNDVLRRYWSNVQRWEDIRDVRGTDLPPADAFCGGFPCQDLSVAGKREGLDGKRSGLWYEFARLIHETKTPLVIIENVPGLLSSGPLYEDPDRPGEKPARRKGIDFAIILAGLTGVIPEIPEGGWDGSGFARGREGFYNVAWRLLDSQYYGVPQRRRRLFIVASLGDGRCAEILFEPESGAWYLAPGEKAEPQPAADAGAGAEADSGRVAPSLTARQRKGGFSDPKNDGLVVIKNDPEQRLRAGGAVAFDWQAGGGKDTSWRGGPRMWIVKKGDYAGALNSVKVQAVATWDNGQGDPNGDDGEASYALNVQANQGAVIAFDRTRGTASGDVTAPLRCNSARSEGVNPGKADNQCVLIPMVARALTAAQGGPSAKEQQYTFLNREGDPLNAFPGRESRYVRNGRGAPGDLVPPLKAQSGQTGKGDGAPLIGVRRFTPRECERLQGFPDDWTLYGEDEEGELYEMSDSARYSMMGNAVTVNVIFWIGLRIKKCTEEG